MTEAKTTPEAGRCHISPGLARPRPHKMFTFGAFLKVIVTQVQFPMEYFTV